MMKRICLILVIVCSSYNSHLYAAALPDRIEIRFIDYNNKVNPNDTILLNHAESALFLQESTTIKDIVDGMHTNYIPLSKGIVTPSAFKQIISLLFAVDLQEAINKLNPESLISIIRPADFLGITRFKNISLSDAILTKLGNYVAAHPQALSQLDMLASGTFFSSNILLNRFTVLTHPGPVNSVAWSPDSAYLVSGSFDDVRVWNVNTGKPLYTLTVTRTSSVAWSPDGTSIAAGSFDRRVRIWNASNGKLLAELKGHPGPVNSVAWSPDGTSIAYASDNTVCIWNVIDGSALTGDEYFTNSIPLNVLTGHIVQVNSVAWSPDGTYIASGGNDKTVRVWNVSTGKSLALTGHTGNVNSVAWSSDSKYIASASDDKTVRIWNVSTGKLLHTLTNAQYIFSVAWSSDSKYIASASTDALHIWNANTGKLLHTLTNAQYIRSVAWSPNGAYLAYGSSDKTVRIWNNIALLNYDATKLSAAQVLVAWFILNNNDQDKITAVMLEIMPNDLLAILIDMVKPNIVQKIRDLDLL